MLSVGPPVVPSVSAHRSGGVPGARYKGSETLELVAVAPNPARCGELPNVEAEFIGEGIDTAGGVFTVEASGCQDIETGRVSDLRAVDEYLDGSSVTIETTSFVLEVDPQTCVSTNAGLAFYEITEGTGRFEDAFGFGRFEFATNEPSCNGESSPAYVWFRGLVFE